MVITLGPLLFGTSLALSSYVVSLRFQDHPDIVASVQEYFIKYLPFLFSFVGLLLMYSVVPIRKIRVRYAVVGALIAAVLFELGKKLFSLYIIYFPSYQNIYGAIAIIPILLFWVYCSWIIIFIGVEIHATLQELYDKRINLKTQSVTEDDFDINE
jgi:membrane protein